MFSAFKLFAHLGEITEVELGGGVTLAAYTQEGDFYTDESGAVLYTAEDGVTDYETEAGAQDYTAEDGVTVYTVEA